MGEKPLYWATTRDGGIALASEIKSLLASGLVDPKIDRSAVDAYLGLSYVPPGRTIGPPAGAGVKSSSRFTQRSPSR